MSNAYHLPDFGHDAASKAAGYAELDAALAALLAGEHDLIANLANTSALSQQLLPAGGLLGFAQRNRERQQVGAGAGGGAAVEGHRHRQRLGALGVDRRAAVVHGLKAKPLKAADLAVRAMQPVRQGRGVAGDTGGAAFGCCAR